jgi:CDP-diacylglycerol--glycerol-3-phosphate 3-phosphatidyltransferase
LITIYQLKPKFQELLRPLVQKLAAIGITANQVTIFACVLSMILGLYLAWYPVTSWFMLIIPFFLFFRMALNAVDGMLAREHNQKSKLGAILNELTDVIADCFLYYPLGLIFQAGGTLTSLFLFLAVLSEMTGVVGIQIGASRRYDGPLGKSDRAFVFGFLALLYVTRLPYENYTPYLFWILCALEVYTIWNRAKNALKEAA